MDFHCCYPYWKLVEDLEVFCLVILVVLLESLADLQVELAQQVDLLAVLLIEDINEAFK